MPVSNHNKKFSIPELFPQPKMIFMESGKSELLPDVRLSTMSVLPIQRKAIRSILTMSGVRVVANKKKYVVDARVEDPADFDLSKVPENVRRDYYELRVVGSEMRVRSPYQEGMVWAAQTMAQLFHLSVVGHDIPNLLIKDWPDCPDRGIRINCDLSSDHMAGGNWYQIIDVLSSVKMNVLEMGIYGHSFAEFLCDNEQNEHLLMGLPQDEDASVVESIQNRMRWYNVKHDRWYDEVSGSIMAVHNQLSEVIAYGKERGVNVLPMIGTFDKTTAMKLMGESLTKLNCWTSDSGSKALKKFYSHLISQYDMEEDENMLYMPVDLSHAFSCSCKTCAAFKSQRLIAYVKWFCGIMSKSGVQNFVLLVNTLPVKNKAAINADFVSAMKASRLMKRLWVQCAENEVAAYRKLGFRIWLEKSADASIYCGMGNCNKTAEELLAKQEKVKADGIVMSTIYDPANLEYLASEGCYAWESKTISAKASDMRARWEFLQFEENKKAVASYEATVAKLASLMSSDLYNLFQPSLECTDAAGQPTWPECALKKMSAGKKTADQLATFIKDARKAYSDFGTLLAGKLRNPTMALALESQKADALRCQAFAHGFAGLLKIYQNVTKNGLKKSVAEECTNLVEEMREILGEYEQIKPEWLVPATMQPFAYLILFLYQLRDDAKARGNKKNAKVKWTMSADWCVPEVY